MCIHVSSMLCGVMSTDVHPCLLHVVGRYVNRCASMSPPYCGSSFLKCTPPLLPSCSRSLSLSLSTSSVQFTSVQFTSVRFSSGHFTSVNCIMVDFISVHFRSGDFTQLQAFTSHQFSSLHFNSFHFASFQLHFRPGYVLLGRQCD